jgi:hypothetical protein
MADRSLKVFPFREVLAGVLSERDVPRSWNGSSHLEIAPGIQVAATEASPMRAFPDFPGLIG